MKDVLPKSLWRRGFHRAARRFVRLSEQTLNEEINARIDSLGVPLNEAGFDPFGFDPQVGKYALSLMALIYRKYFRVEVQGIDALPAGRLLVVANHSGQLPFDAMMISTALMLEATPPRLARSMVEKWTASLPFVSSLYPRCGQVVGSRENARRLLQRGETLLVFPEGVRGIAKTFERRYRLAEFGSGFVRLALETQTPVVPVAVIGAEEQYISVADLKPLARLFGMPTLPVVPQVLFSGPLPLPTKYRIVFGEPIHFGGDADDDETSVGKKAQQVRRTVQEMLRQGLQARTGVFF